MNFGKRELEAAIAKNPASFPLNVLYENFEHFEAVGGMEWMKAIAHIS